MSSSQLPQNRGARAGIVATTWVFTTAAVAVVVLQLALKLIKHKALELNDWLIASAVVVALGQSIAVSEAVSKGLGMPMSEITTLVQFEQAIYASQVLYVVALGLAKIASAHTASRVSTLFKFIYAGRSLVVISALWTATALVSTALQCTPLSQVWQIFSEQCFDQESFWDAIGALDILTDVAIAALASHISSSLEMPWSKKTPVIASFWCKLLAAPFLVARLVLLRNRDTSVGPPLATASLAVVTQIQMSIAVLASSIPYLRMCLTHFEAGVFTTNMRLTPGFKASKLVNLAPIHVHPAPVADRRYLDPAAEPDRHLSVRGSVARSVGASSMNSARMVISKKMSFWVEEEPASGRWSQPLRTPRTPRSPKPAVPQIQESFYEE